MSESPVREGPDGSGELEVQVVPRASRSRVVGLHDGRLKVQLAAPPVDGAANAALIDLLADTLELPRARIELLRGHAGKRKTVRIALAAAELRRRLGLAALLLAAPACESSYAFPIAVVLPDDTDDLERADNLTLEIGPNALQVNYDVDGTDFTVELELDPDSETRTLSMYLAEGTELLAWGRSAPFVLSAPPADLGIYLTPPGALSTFPGKIGHPDPARLAGPALGRGILMLDSDGATGLFNVFTLATESGATLEPKGGLPDPGDGALIPDTRGNVWRVAWAESLRAFIYLPADDEWTTAALGDGAGARPGAAHLQDATRERLLVLGGGEQRSVVEINLVPDDDDKYAVTTLAQQLDAPRRGATALYLLRSDGDVGEGVVLVGSDDATTPLAYFLREDDGVAFGPAEAWTGMRCVQVERDDAAQKADYVRVLCLGGLRGATPTADAIVLNFPPATAEQPPNIDVLPDFLPEPAADPRLFEDAAAIYAQSGALWLRIDRSALTTEAFTSPSPRVRGGHSVLLSTGATFLVGGWTGEDRPVDHWHVFAPALGSSSAAP
jgi:uncharacterized protein (TIGR00251 family)